MDNILEYLEKTVSKYPRQIAVDDGSICFTWGELENLSKRTGSAFSRKTETKKPIAILMKKSSITLAAMFGAVYAGCFYVVIDPEQPSERIGKILDILSPEIVVVNSESADLLEGTKYCGKKYFIYDAVCEKPDLENLKEIRKNRSAEDLLYGIFTSGSTGVPKGVVVSHRAVIDFITHFVNIFGFTQKERIGNQAPFDFDVSVKDIYSCVFTGARLVLIPREMFSTPSMLIDYLCDNDVTALIWAASALSLIASLKGLSYRVPQTVKKIFFSGEVMPVKQLRKWQEALCGAEFVNLYGPSEITCNCTYYRVNKLFEDDEKIPIGGAFPGRRVFLLDEEGKEVTDRGMTGEICVMGESLSEGYYHNKGETDRHFFYKKIVGNKEERCYMTGDLGYYGEDGQLFFAGRKDFQIKHMGHRVELEEIESAMEQIDGVERGLCVVDGKRNMIVGFYIGNADVTQVRQKIKTKLPIYMIPHKLVKTDFMPLNKNGKKDREYFRRRIEQKNEN